MNCVALPWQLKPADALVWAFSLIKSRWPNAGAWHEDREVWTGLAPAFQPDPYTAIKHEGASPLAMAGLVETISVRVEDERLILCAEPELLSQITCLPQWRHRLQPYEQPVVEQSEQIEPEQQALSA